MPKNKKNIKVHDLKPSKDAKGGGGAAQGHGAQGHGAQGHGAQGHGAQGHGAQRRHGHQSR
jgi:hypothetical protein